jgi:hypothetical protein
MSDSSSCYDVTITVDSDGGHLPNPAEFAAAAEQAALARAASIMSAHTAEKIISIVTFQAADRSRSCCLSGTRLDATYTSG